MNFNSEELNKIGLMLDDLVSNSRNTFDLIDYDLQQICDILAKYHDLEVRSFRKEAADFSSNWYSSKNNIISVGFMLSEKIISYCNASKENVNKAVNDLNETSKKLDDLSFE